MRTVSDSSKNRFSKGWSWCAALLLATLTGCAIAPKHPALQSDSLAPPIPVRDFVANTASTGGYKLSPDGRNLAWFGVDGVSVAIWVKQLDTGRAKAFKARARGYLWSADSQFLVILADQGGDENIHLYAGRVAGPDTTLIDRTPFAQSTNHVLRVVDGGDTVVIGSNRRDKRLFDVYRLSLGTGALDLIAENHDEVGYWGVDRQGKLLARVTFSGASATLQRSVGITTTSTASSTLSATNATSTSTSTSASGWQTTAQWSRFDTVYPLDILPDKDHALALSNRGRDKIAVVELDLRDGHERVLHATPDVDVDQVLLHRKTHALRAVYSMPDYPRLTLLDEQLRAPLARLNTGKPVELAVTSVSDDDTRMTVVASTDQGSKYYLFDGPGAAPQFLGESRVSMLGEGLSSTQPIQYTSRDGLLIHGYLTLPLGVAPKGLPMVLLVHGGPMARDRWTSGGPSRSLQQFFANRGYAVLQVNYRGSSGYGKAFMERAVGEFAGKMHDDLIDGVNWAVASGLADAKKVAIYGASYGGYAALVGATFTPETFACAVDVVGVSDLGRFMETVPPYWDLGMAWWKRYVGDPSDPAQRRVMDAKSPLYRAAAAGVPLLIMHGVNDPRVRLEQSEKMVAALRLAGKPVDYYTFKGDGHGNQKWNNNLTMYRKSEDFLAQCLGGRSKGLDYYELGSWAF